MVVDKYTDVHRLGMDESFHTSQLQSHCRVCGSPTHRHKSTQSCSKYAEKLKIAYGIDVSLDSKLILTVTFCTPCYSAMGRILKSGMVKSCVVVFDWTEHRDDCKVYIKYKV